MKTKRTARRGTTKRSAKASREAVLKRMPRRQSLFWDVDPKMVDPKKHAKYIIERILQFGTDDEVRWMVRAYAARRIGETLRRSRGVLSKKTKALWSLIYQ